MKVLLIIIIILIGLVAIASCSMAGHEENKADRQYSEYIKSRNKANNKTNNEGE